MLHFPSGKSDGEGRGNGAFLTGPGGKEDGSLGLPPLGVFLFIILFLFYFYFFL